MLSNANRFSLETSEVSTIFFFHNQNKSTSSPGLLGNDALPIASSIFDVISSSNTKFFQIWSSLTGYGELWVCF